MRENKLYVDLNNCLLGAKHMSVLGRFVEKHSVCSDPQHPRECRVAEVIESQGSAQVIGLRIIFIATAMIIPRCHVRVGQVYSSPPWASSHIYVSPVVVSGGKVSASFAANSTMAVSFAEITFDVEFKPAKEQQLSGHAVSIVRLQDRAYSTAGISSDQPHQRPVCTQTQ